MAVADWKTSQLLPTTSPTVQTRPTYLGKRT